MTLSSHCYVEYLHQKSLNIAGATSAPKLNAVVAVMGVGYDFHKIAKQKEFDLPPFRSWLERLSPGLLLVSS